jgi:ketosteroid isomerase-like protein
VSQQNVETVSGAFAAFASRGVEALLDFMASDGVCYTAPEWVEESEYQGHDGLRSLISVFTDNFDDWTIDLVELRDAGDSVVALIEHEGKIKGTDTPLRQPMGIVSSDFRRGQIGMARFFQTWREALKAAGLSE